MFDTVLYSAFCYVRSENWYTCPPPKLKGSGKQCSPCEATRLGAGAKGILWTFLSMSL